METYKTNLLDLRCCDNMDLMAEYPDKHFDLAVVDPPYGIGADKAQNKALEKFGYKHYKQTDWDSEIPKQEYWNELFRVSKNQIIWGGNYFTKFLKPSMGWIIWDKGQRDFSLADGEMAWTSFNKAMRIFECSRVKALCQQRSEGGRIHPTQKPISLYDWIFKKYVKKENKILDTHLGSGSIAIASHYAGLHLTACEIDEDYFKESVDRIKRGTAQQSLF